MLSMGKSTDMAFLFIFTKETDENSAGYRFEWFNYYLQWKHLPVPDEKKRGKKPQFNLSCLAVSNLFTSNLNQFDYELKKYQYKLKNAITKK